MIPNGVPGQLLVKAECDFGPVLYGATVWHSLLTVASQAVRMLLSAARLIVNQRKTYL